MSPPLTLGPIIGKVDSGSARILVEADAATNLTVELRKAGIPVDSKTLPVQADRIAPFAFQGLAAQTSYTVHVSGASSSVASSGFRTLAVSPTTLRIGALSCNRNKDGNAWSKLAAQIANLDLLVHMGDQVYVDHDDAFDDALAIWHDTLPNKDDRILELFRDRYRSMWAVPETRDVLANVPNLAIWDDHEIRNDFGTRPEDRDPTSDVHGVGKLARRVYREYQRCLFEDPVPVPPPWEPEYHAHAFGPIGIAFLETRSARTFEPDPPTPPLRPYLGKAQWERFKKDLQSDTLAAVRALLVVSPTPPVLVDPWLAALFAVFEPSLKDQWPYAPHRREQKLLLELLRGWKSAGQREVFVVAGDLHLGVERTTIRRGSVEFRQMISSAFNTVCSTANYGLVRLGLTLSRSPGWGFHVEHSGYLHRRNFGIIQIDAPTNATPTVTASLVAAE